MTGSGVSISTAMGTPPSRQSCGQRPRQLLISWSSRFCGLRRRRQAGVRRRLEVASSTVAPWLATSSSRHSAAYRSPSFSMIAVYTVVAIPILSAATELCSAARIRSYRNATSRPWSVCAPCPNVSGVLQPWLPRRCQIGKHWPAVLSPTPGPSPALPWHRVGIIPGVWLTHRHESPRLSS